MGAAPPPPTLSESAQAVETEDAPRRPAIPVEALTYSNTAIQIHVNNIEDVNEFLNQVIPQMYDAGLPIEVAFRAIASMMDALNMDTSEVNERV